MIPGLSPRLETAAEMCRKNTVIADVGTDHALLACFLAGGARSVIASDIKDGPLRAAARNVERFGVKNVSVVRSDGLDSIPYADDVVVCGMGGELIADIVLRCRFVTENTRFILQPMTKPDELRRRLYSGGFEIIEERVCRDTGRLYAVMSARYTGARREIDELFAMTGKITDAEYLTRTADKLMRRVRGMEKSALPQSGAKELEELAALIYARSKEFL